MFTGVLLGTLGVLVHTGDAAVPLAIGIVVPASIAIARTGRD